MTTSSSSIPQTQDVEKNLFTPTAAVEYSVVSDSNKHSHLYTRRDCKDIRKIRFQEDDEDDDDDDEEEEYSLKPLNMDLFVTPPSYLPVLEKKKKMRQGFSIQGRQLGMCTPTKPSTSSSSSSSTLSFSSFPEALPIITTPTSRLNTSNKHNTSTAFLSPYSSPHSRQCTSMKRTPSPFSNDMELNTCSKRILRSPCTSFPDYSPVVGLPTPAATLEEEEDEELEEWTNEDTLSIGSLQLLSRPLPDQSAFDTSYSSSKRSNTPQRSPTCPPTPVRRPTWAQEQRTPTFGSLGE